MPDDLVCEYTTNPSVIESQHPHLSWKLKSNERNQVQTSYEILVSSSEDKLERGIADVWSSGIVNSAQSQHVIYNGPLLHTGNKYYWRVRVGDKHSNISPWSETASWEMGLLNPGDWKGEWIGYETETAPLFRKEFSIKKSVQRATAYICGLGYYELRVNGKKISDHVLDPGQTDYELRAFYVVHDVTRNLIQGHNALGVELGNGFYNQTAVNSAHFGWGDVVYGKPRFIAQVHIRFNDGSDTLIVSDTGWKASEGPTTFNNVYVGDFYDARLEQDGWDMAGFNDSGWDQAIPMDSPGRKLVSQKLQPIKSMQTLRPVKIDNTRQGVYVYDMGQNFAGWAKLNLKAPEGTEITLRYSEEIFENGDINLASCGGYATFVVQTDKYICKGSGEKEVWEPHFTYHGFRYVEMTGYPGTPALDNLEGKVVYSSLEKTGSFSCSDTMFNKVHKAAWWTLTSNIHSILEDCPHREKCGWLGDIMPEVLMLNLDAPLLVSKIERDIETSRLEQKPGKKNDGPVDYEGIPWDVSPGRRVGGHAADWCSKYIQLPWFMYLYYGDISLAEEHWEGMTRFMTHLGNIAKDHIIYEGYGDMFQPGSIMPKNPPNELTTSALYYYNCIIMASLARVLEYEDEAMKYENLSIKIKEAFNEKFYDQEKNWYGSQTATAMAIEFGLVPGKDVSMAAKELARDIMENHNGHFSTGQMGGRYLHEALSRNGYGHIAKIILNQTTYPSIGYLFAKGATTFWESWGEEEIDENSSGVRSRNHPFQSGCDDWFFKGVGGINPDPENPGFKNIILKPELTGCLTAAQTSYQSIYGIIRSNWEMKNGDFTWYVSVPVNCTADVFLPATEPVNIFESGSPLKDSKDVEIIGISGNFVHCHIGSGDYQFIIIKE